ncbi:MAG TPA: phosphopantothenoylcysteine decarboxylase [Roseimicrobium sp.]|nr:phosphopantothenoylcysteine decarboxylase [Roseimicrobium sp.]
MNIIVTCGPGFEPLDEVRRLTNFSTGELGVRLSEALSAAGHHVICLKGSGATYRDPGAACIVRHFDTNDDLLAALKQESVSNPVDAVFHVAALCDYKVARIEDDAGAAMNSPKIASRAGNLHLTLEPATKVIAQLRPLFPKAWLVGWKYELAGTRDEAMSKALKQLAENHTDACVLNGRAWGTGFALCQKNGKTSEAADKAGIVELLTSRVDS